MEAAVIVAAILGGYLVVIIVALVFLYRRAKWINDQKQELARIHQPNPIPCSYELLSTQLPLEQNQYTKISTENGFFYGYDFEQQQQQQNSSPDSLSATNHDIYYSTNSIPIIVSSPESTYHGRSKNSYEKSNYPPKIVLDDLWKPVSENEDNKRNKLSLELQLNSHSPLMKANVNNKFNGLQENELRAFDGSDEAYSSIFTDSIDCEPVSPMSPRSPRSPRSPKRKKIKKERTSLKDKLKSKLVKD